MQKMAAGWRPTEQDVERVAYDLLDILSHLHQNHVSPFPCTMSCCICSGVHSFCCWPDHTYCSIAPLCKAMHLRLDNPETAWCQQRAHVN